MQIDAAGNRAATAIAYYVAGKQEFQAGDYSSARRDFETALRNDPQNPAILNFYAALLVKTGNAQQAMLYAQRAVEQAPDSADAYAVLGYAQYSADHPRDAIQSWKKSLALRPDASIKQLLDRTERERYVESNFSERETGHFILRYEGTQTSDTLRAQILETLESAYQDLSREFGNEPRSSIPVVLYTSQDFFDVTRAPGWVGALNDGKIRIPFRGVNSVTPAMARILRHELTHSFVNQATQGRCPQWLNEGIAQMLEPRPLGDGPALARLFKTDREIPLNSMEGGFSIVLHRPGYAGLCRVVGHRLLYSRPVRHERRVANIGKAGTGRIGGIGAAVDHSLRLSAAAGRNRSGINSPVWRLTVPMWDSARYFRARF